MWKSIVDNDNICRNIIITYSNKCNTIIMFVNLEKYYSNLSNSFSKYSTSLRNSIWFELKYGMHLYINCSYILFYIKTDLKFILYMQDINNYKGCWHVTYFIPSLYYPDGEAINNCQCKLMYVYYIVEYVNNM